MWRRLYLYVCKPMSHLPECHPNILRRVSSRKWVSMIIKSVNGAFRNADAPGEAASMCVVPVGHALGFEEQPTEPV